MAVEKSKKSSTRSSTRDSKAKEKQHKLFIKKLEKEGDEDQLYLAQNFGLTEELYARMGDSAKKVLRNYLARQPESITKMLIKDLNSLTPAGISSILVDNIRNFYNKKKITVSEINDLNRKQIKYLVRDEFMDSDSIDIVSLDDIERLNDNALEKLAVNPTIKLLFKDKKLKVEQLNALKPRGVKNLSRQSSLKDFTKGNLTVKELNRTDLSNALHRFFGGTDAPQPPPLPPKPPSRPSSPGSQGSKQSGRRKG